MTATATALKWFLNVANNARKTKREIITQKASHLHKVKQIVWCRNINSAFRECFVQERMAVKLQRANTANKWCYAMRTVYCEFMRVCLWVSIWQCRRQRWWWRCQHCVIYMTRTCIDVVCLCLCLCLCYAKATRVQIQYFNFYVVHIYVHRVSRYLVHAMPQ